MDDVLRLDEDDRKMWAEVSLFIMNDAFPHDSYDVRTWPQCERLFPHVMTAADHAEDLGVATNVGLRSLNHAGIYLEGRAQLREAKALLGRVLAIDKKNIRTRPLQHGRNCQQPRFN